MSSYKYRYITWFCLESLSPLRIASGESGLENEGLIVRDANGLPYIPGTSLAGILRHKLGEHEAPTESKKLQTEINKYFGFHDDQEGTGSLITVSAASMLSQKMDKVLEAYEEFSGDKEFYEAYKRVTERDHVRIGHQGTAKKYAKFQEQLVYTGTRFCGEIEMKGNETDAVFFNKIIDSLKSTSFRVGAGTRNGFGEFKVIKLKADSYDLTAPDELDAYLKRSSSLNQGLDFSKEEFVHPIEEDAWEEFSFKLKARDFFYFGSGNVKRIKKKNRKKGDEEREQYTWMGSVPKTEQKVSWNSGEAKIEEASYYLIPGTSLKGALSHRTAFHYNKITGNTIESTGNLKEDELELDFDIQKELASFALSQKIEQMDYPLDSPQWEKWENEIEAMSIEQSEKWKGFEGKIIDVLEGREERNLLPVEERNKAVQTLFGYAKNSEDKSLAEGARGNVIISDIYLKSEHVKTQKFSHVAIDRFTGGALDGALFEEEVISYSGSICLKILVKKSAIKDKAINNAFELALDDLKTGQLPLGGNVAKGHGVFELAN